MTEEELTALEVEKKKWPEPPASVWVWGKYRKWQETYCDPTPIKWEEFEIPVYEYVRADAIAELRRKLANAMTQDDPCFTHAFKMRAEAAEARVARLEAALRKNRWYVEVYDTREHNRDQDQDLTEIDAALDVKGAG